MAMDQSDCLILCKCIIIPINQCVHNVAALRVQISMALDPVSGNCGRKKGLFNKE